MIAAGQASKLTEAPFENDYFGPNGGSRSTAHRIALSRLANDL